MNVCCLNFSFQFSIYKKYSKKRNDTCHFFCQEKNFQKTAVKCDHPHQRKAVMPEPPSPPFLKDLKIVNTPGLIVSAGDEGRNARMIVVNNKAIPCCAAKCPEGGKAVAIKLHFINPYAVGYGKVPYRSPADGQKYKPPPDAKVLSQIDGSHMKIWSFESEGTDKGPRCENISWTLEPADTIIFYVNSKNFRNANEAKKLFDVDVDEIPAFSVLQIELQPKGSKTITENFSGHRITGIRFFKHSLYSFTNILKENFPKNIQEATQRMQQRHENELNLVAKDLEMEEVCFLHNVDSRAFCNSDDTKELGYVRLCSCFYGNEESFIDIPVDQLLRYTNCAKIEWACKLLEVAANCNALKMFVSRGTRWARFTEGKRQSEFRGIPLIDLEKMLFGRESSKNPSGDETTFVFDNKQWFFVTGDNEEENWIQPMSVEINGGFEKVEGDPKPLDDFRLTSPDIHSQKAYRISFHAKETENHEAIENVFTGFFSMDVAKQVSGLARMKRKRTESMV
jgi:hypothetical protein